MSWMQAPLFLILAALFVGGSPAKAAFWGKDGTTEKPWKTDSTAGLKIIWWNIACGSADADPATQDQLFHNLFELTQLENQVDLIMMSEYCPAQIRAQTSAALGATYPHRAYIPYNPTAAARIAGIAIFSKFEFKVEDVETVTFNPRNASPDEIQKYRDFWFKTAGNAFLFDRSYIHLTLQKDGKIYDILPEHFMNPWLFIEKIAGGGFVGKAEVAKQLVFGDDNPLMNQIHEYLDKFQRDFPHPEGKNLILMGDFNFPRRIGGLETKAHQTISQYLENAMTSEEPSFPSYGLKIDQAFIPKGRSLPESMVLPFLGSDHFPIFVHLE